MFQSNEIKMETDVGMDMDNVCQKFMELIKSKPNGATNTDLNQNFPELAAAKRVEVLNALLKQGVVEVLKKGDKLYYRHKEKRDINIPKDADNEEKIVYGIIAEGGNKGIWIRDIRLQCNLNMTQLNKILKNLETKKLIKAVKSVNASKKKVYMLYNLEADRSVTGGAWYQDQDFESEFVDVLNQQCLRFLQMKRDNADRNNGPIVFMQMATCTVKEVHKYISDLGISKISLDEDDLETILKTIVYDGNAERIPLPNGGDAYRAVTTPLPPVGLVQTACGVCPLIANCSTCGDITPIKCQYMNDWLR